MRGITPDLFYGGYARSAEGRLIPHSGLRDCLSVYGSTNVLDVNTAAPEAMMAVGVPADTAAAIVALRKAAHQKQMSSLSLVLVTIRMIL